MQTPQIGYCTNVHAGTTLEQVKQNLLTHACEVHRALGKSTALPIGLWLSDTASNELSPDALAAWRDWLCEHQLKPYTLNGFPFSDFHQDVVKHDVYLPTWAEPSRLEYTFRLAQILDAILPKGEVGTISTLPISWPTGRKNRLGANWIDSLSNVDRACVVESAKNLKTLALRLADLQQSSGRLIKVCLEPEPGCVLDTAGDIASFFEQLLFDDSANREIVQQHIGVCHDVCHSAVMFEPQQTAIQIYRDAGIDIGKIQISSAIEMPSYCDANVNALRAFAEPRYLHQTVIRNVGSDVFFEDLSLALAQPIDQIEPTSPWRVHFHVPIYLERLGFLKTTQSEIKECIAAMAKLPDKPHPTHYEVETYAWSVLPEQHAQSSLPLGIAEEIHWFEQLLAVHP